MIKIKKYQILEHKADLKIKAFGKNREELFLNMFLGMNESLKPVIGKTEEKIRTPRFSREPCFPRRARKIKREIQIKSLDLPVLLVDFLSEVLYLIQVNREIYNDIKFKKLTKTELEAEIFGQKVERFGEDIKAVTYHALDVYQRKDRDWEATVLFDI